VCVCVCAVCGESSCTYNCIYVCACVHACARASKVLVCGLRAVLRIHTLTIVPAVTVIALLLRLGIPKVLVLMEGMPTLLPPCVLSIVVLFFYVIFKCLLLVQKLDEGVM
jgi:hypothetical protein